ncbi:hypothetical protein Ptr902_09835 [Pyrenophora tritici-repentis]|nr:hypothetical protein Ptr902_09835 [Pyrenophora tritici-repentis]
MPAIESLEPVYPAIPPEPVKPTTPTSEPTPKYQVSLEEYNHKKAAYQLAVKNHEEDFNDWQALYAKAQAFELHEVRGDLAVTDFLDALAAKIAPN